MRKGEHSLNISGHNTLVELESLGEVELRYVSMKSIRDIRELLEKNLSDRDFVLSVLHAQITKPQIAYADFQKIPDTELNQLGAAFVKAENHIFKGIFTSGDFMKNFKEALKSYINEQAELSRRTIESIIHSAQQSYKHLATVIAGASPKIEIPRLERLSGVESFEGSEVVRERNAWERHKQTLDAQTGLADLMRAILGEQQTTTMLTKWVLVVTVAGLLIAVVSLCIGGK